MKLIKSITNCYKKMSNFGKILIFIALLLIVVVFFRTFNPKKEGFGNNNVDTVQGNFLFKEGEAVYDDFYAGVYDYLVFNQVKNDYEIGAIKSATSLDEKSIIADIGCGTGHHVANLRSNNLSVIGIDISPSMIQEAKKKYPDLRKYFKVGDVLNGTLFKDESLTHILSLYFTIYYIENKMLFFNNCMNWLMPGGYLIVHLVDKYKFDPILPPGNPLLYVSPQRYAKERITSTKVKFTDFSYSADFKFDNENDKALFVEKFKNDNDGKVRKNEHTLYMPDIQQIVDEAQSCGFIVEAKADLLQCQYEYQYLYVFVKPN